MASRLWRTLAWLTIDALIVGALVFPQLAAYLRWPFFAAYAALTYVMLENLSDKQWVFTIIRDGRTRIAHGLEHATIAVLAELGHPVLGGFTHWNNRFVIVLEAGHAHRTAAVADAAASAIRRIRRGEQSLAYHPGCGMSKVVAGLSLWLFCVSSAVFSLAIGASSAIFFAISALAFRFWLTSSTVLGLLAQRWFTVSTAFSVARVVDVSETSRVLGLVRPDDETWFEVVVEFTVAAAEGGLVPI
jgi:hypothetical protein